MVFARVYGNFPSSPKVVIADISLPSDIDFLPIGEAI